MQFGVFLPHQLPRPWSPEAEMDLLHQSIEQVVRAEQAGVACVWGQEHHFLEEYSHSSAPEVYLAAIAARTSTIRIGFGVMLMPPGFNAPFRSAERVATLDLVSRGRVEWGTGASASRMELDGFHIPLTDRRAMWEEAVREAARMLALDPYPGVQGKYFSAPPRNVVPKPAQRPHPPLWVACANRDAVREAARAGVGALTFAFSDAAEARFWVEEYYETFKRECEPIGASVNPNIAMLSSFMCHPDRRVAIERGSQGARFFAHGLAHYYASGDHTPGATQLWSSFAQSPPPEPTAAPGGIGTPGELLAHFQAFEEAGVDQLILLMQAGNYQHAHILESLDLLGRDIAPAFRARHQEREQAKAAELAPHIARANARIQARHAAKAGPVRSFPAMAKHRGIVPSLHRGRSSIASALWSLNTVPGREEELPLPASCLAPPSRARSTPPRPAPARNLLDAIALHTERSPERTAVAFHRNGSRVSRFSFRQLHDQAEALASLLQERQGKGQRALLTHTDPTAMLVAFLGCLHSGVIPIPAYPPRSDRNLRRLQAILSSAQASLVLTDAAGMDLARQSTALAPELLAATWLDTSRGPSSPRNAFTPVRAAEHDVLFLQYTSGSTQTPRGAAITQGNLSANLRALSAGWRVGPDSTFACWLPLFHDLGLVGHALAALVNGVPCHLLSPEEFVATPRSWLALISDTGATISGGPNFAFDLCVRKIPAEHLAALDLSTWRVAINGAEPVRAATLERFSEAFRPCGFRRASFAPSFGMSEATAYVAGDGADTEPLVLSLHRQALEEGRVVHCAPEDPEATPLVGCGPVAPDFEALIVNPATRERCAQGQVGELWLRGPSVAATYWRQPEETLETLGAQLSAGDSSPHLRTGDLAFFHEGELVIAGRLKDLLIVRGRNIFPQDIEALVDGTHPLVRAGCCAAGVWDAPGEEQVAVACEVQIAPGSSTTAATFEAICKAIRERISEHLEISVSELFLLAPRTLPKTSSGKLQRRQTFARLRDGSLESIHRSTARSPEPLPLPLRQPLLTLRWSPFDPAPSSPRAQGLTLVGWPSDPLLQALLRQAEEQGTRCTIRTLEEAFHEKDALLQGQLLLLPPVGYEDVLAEATCVEQVWTLLERAALSPDPCWLVTRAATSFDLAPQAPVHAALWALTGSLMLSGAQSPLHRIDLDAASPPEEAAGTLLAALGVLPGSSAHRGGSWFEPTVVPSAPPRTTSLPASALVAGTGGRTNAAIRWLKEHGTRTTRWPSEAPFPEVGGRDTCLFLFPSLPAAPGSRGDLLRDAFRQHRTLAQALSAGNIQPQIAVLSAASLLGAPGAEWRVLVEAFAAALLDPGRRVLLRLGPWTPSRGDPAEHSASIAELEEPQVRDLLLHPAPPGTDHTVLAANLPGLLGAFGFRKQPRLFQRLSTPVHLAPIHQREPPATQAQIGEEAILIEIFRALLQVDQVGAHDTFSGLGGDSMLSVQLFQQIEQRFRQPLRMSDLRGPVTPRAIAEQLRARRAGPTATLARENTLHQLLVEPPYHYAVLRDDDLQEATDLLCRQLAQTPMAQALALPAQALLPLVSFACKQAAREALSVVVRAGSKGPLVGAGVSTDLEAYERAHLPAAAPALAPYMAARSALLGLYQRPPQDRLLFLNFAGVDRAAEGSLLAHRLAMLSLDLAAARGYQRAIGQIQSASLQALFLQELGFVERARIDFQRFEWHGRRPFASIQVPPAVLLLERRLAP